MNSYIQNFVFLALFFILQHSNGITICVGIMVVLLVGCYMKQLEKEKLKINVTVKILLLEKYYRCKSTNKNRHQHRIHQIAKTQYIHQIAKTYINTEQQNQSRNP